MKDGLLKPKKQGLSLPPSVERMIAQHTVIMEGIRIHSDTHKPVLAVHINDTRHQREFIIAREVGPDDEPQIPLEPPFPKEWLVLFHREDRDMGILKSPGDPDPVPSAPKNKTKKRRRK